MDLKLPYLGRRRKMPGTRTFNSSKVFADYSSSLLTAKTSLYDETFHPKKIHNVPGAGKSSKPDPVSVSFLYENPRFVCEPICFANTSRTKNRQSRWWPESPIPERRVNPKYSQETVNRIDFQQFDCSKQPISTRFGCTPHKSKYVKGIVPTLHEESYIAREKISYEHQYDCRQGRKERGKLHGSFVWKPIDDTPLIERIQLRLRQQKSSIFTQ